MKHSDISKVMRKWLLETDDNIIGVTYEPKSVGGKFTRRNSIVFYVKEKLPKDQLKEEQILPKYINIKGKDIPTDVVQQVARRLTTLSYCEPTFYTWMNPYTPPDNQDEWRALRGGVSCANWDNMGVVYIGGTSYVMKDFIGTLGLLAVDNEDGSLVAITNHHVVIYDAFICSERIPVPGGDVSAVNNVKGDNVTQPNETGAIYGKHGIDYSIGKVKRYYPIRATPSINYIDTALVAVNIDSYYPPVVDGNSWHQVGLTPPVNYPWASTAEIDALNRNTLLYSTGRTSGAKGEGVTKLRFWGFGDLPISYNMQGSEVWTTAGDCILYVATTDLPPADPSNLCYYPIAAGDSGSALIANIGGVKKIVGLAFGGITDNTGADYKGAACRIDNIASMLNVSAWNGGATNYSNVSNIMELTVDGLDDREYIDYGGNRYWQVGLRNK
jgi:hypothetical protein